MFKQPKREKILSKLSRCPTRLLNTRLSQNTNARMGEGKREDDVLRMRPQWEEDATP